MIFVTDAAGHCVYVSTEWTTLTGQAVAEALGEGWLARIHADDRNMVADTIDRAVRQSAEFGVRYRLLRPDETSRWVGAGGVPAFEVLGDAFAGHLGTITQITEAADTLTASGTIERFRPPPPHPATMPASALDLTADHLILAHALIEGDGGKDALPDLRKALFKIGRALAARSRERSRLN